MQNFSIHKKKTYTVGIYSPGNALVVQLINRQVLPTALYIHEKKKSKLSSNEIGIFGSFTYPSPTTTHLMACIIMMMIFFGYRQNKPPDTVTYTLYKPELNQITHTHTNAQNKKRRKQQQQK